MEYRVTWIIDVEADSHLDAAVKARQSQLRSMTTATVFEVVAREGGEDAGLPEEIDLAKDYRPGSLPASDPRSEEYPAYLEGQGW